MAFGALASAGERTAARIAAYLNQNLPGQFRAPIGFAARREFFDLRPAFGPIRRGAREKRIFRVASNLLTQLSIKSPTFILAPRRVTPALDAAHISSAEEALIIAQLSSILTLVRLGPSRLRFAAVLQRAFSRFDSDQSRDVRYSALNNTPPA